MSKPRSHVGKSAARLVNAPLTKPEPAPTLKPGVPAKLTYLLAAHRIERRANGWYVCKAVPSFLNTKPEWSGAYETIEGACLVIARHLATECADRHTRDIEGHKLAADHPLYGLKATTKL